VKQARLVALVLACACAKGQSVVEVRVSTTAGTVLTNVVRLEVSVDAPVDGNTKTSQTVSIPNLGSIPPEQRFALRFDANVQGAGVVTVFARDSGGNPLASAQASVNISPSESTHVEILLPGGAPPDMTVAPPDLAPPPKCNPVTQSGCASGQKCTIDGNCQPDGTQLVGDPCTDVNQHSNCAAGSGCGSTTGAICRQYCYKDSDCTQGSGPGGSPNNPFCLISVSGTQVKLCTIPCNPVASAGSSGCAAGLVCDYYDADPSVSQPEYTDCEPPGTAATGAGCTSVQCAPNNTCVHGNVTMMDICRQMCRPGVAGDCPSGDTCFQFNGAQLSFGFCCPSAGC
jgi:hypothetical protein